jgi:AcrR family transcriptional regulator
MKAEYKNSIRSRVLIKNAMYALLAKKKDLALITVSDVVKEADINRGTFYNHYRNVGEVVNEIVDDLLNKLVATIEISEHDSDGISHFVKAITDFLKQNEKQYRLIINYIPRGVLNYMKEKAISGIGRNYLKELDKNEETEVKIHFIANGLAGTYLDYLTGEINIPIDKLAEVTAISISELMMPVVSKKAP